MKIIELKPVRHDPADYDAIEAEIREVLRRKIYLPLMRLVTGKNQVTSLPNAKDSALTAALRQGRISFGRGIFSGRFSAETSKELRSLGATWDRTTSTYRLRSSELPEEVLAAAKAGTTSYLAQIEKVEAALRQLLPEKIAGSVKLSDRFDRTISKVDKELKASFGKLAVMPELTAKARRIIADEWEENTQLYIRNFTQAEIKKLRAEIKVHVLDGGRFEHVTASIRRSYGVTERKARFLARQETGLLMSKFKKARYTESGSNEYRWRTVAGSPKHPVRPSHKKLDGTIHRWDSPPITTAPNEPVRRCHPGEDFECRCTAIPIVRF